MEVERPAPHGASIATDAPAPEPSATIAESRRGSHEGSEVPTSHPVGVVMLQLTLVVALGAFLFFIGTNTQTGWLFVVDAFLAALLV